jgi:trk system potassium uptake protein
MNKKKTSFEFDAPDESDLAKGFWQKRWAEAKEFFGGNSARTIISFFVFLIISGTLLLLLPFSTVSGQSPPVLVALFTATSAATVTGLVIVDTGSYWSTFGHVVILLLTNIGAIGFASSSVFVLLTRHRATFDDRRTLHAALGKGGNIGILRLALFVIVVTLVCEAIGAIFLFIGWVGELGVVKAAWWAVFHSVTAFANDGFDLAGTVEKPYPSLTAFSGNYIICITIPLLIILGGIGYNVIFELLQFPKTKRLSLNSKICLWGTLILVVGGTLLIWLREAGSPKTLGGMDFTQQGVNAFFQAVSPRTAGFNTIDLTAIDSFTVFVLIILMFIGGGSGSAAGGLKITTLVVIIASVRSSILGQPNTLWKHTIPQRVVAQAMAIGAVYVGLVIFFTLLISFIEPIALTPILFDVISALCTVGMSLGVTPNFAPLSQLILVAAMFLGRLGVIIIIVALNGEQRPAPLVTYPEEDIMVG